MADLFLIAAAAAEHGEAAEPTALGFTPGGWVALSMVALFVIMLVLRVPSLIGKALDSKIASIRALLDEAATLRKEAEALKAEYEAKLADAASSAERLTNAATDEARHIIAKAEADAAQLIARRERMAQDKIAAAGLAAEAELRSHAAEAAARAAGLLIKENHSAEADKSLVDQAIASI